MNRRILRFFETRCPRIMARGRNLRGEGGDAIIELALILALVGIPMLVGTANLAIVMYASIEVSNAAHAGAMYGMQSSTYASDTSQMQTIAQEEAADFGTNLTVTPTTYYACSSAIGGTQYSTQSAANTACTGSGNHTLQFVQVAVTTTYTPKIHLPVLPSTFTLSNKSVMEVEE